MKWSWKCVWMMTVTLWLNESFEDTTQPTHERAANESFWDFLNQDSVVILYSSKQESFMEFGDEYHECSQFLKSGFLSWNLWSTWRSSVKEILFWESFVVSGQLRTLSPSEKGHRMQNAVLFHEWNRSPTIESGQKKSIKIREACNR